MAKSIPYFRLEMLENDTCWGGTYLYGLYMGVPPSAPPLLCHESPPSPWGRVKCCFNHFTGHTTQHQVESGRFIIAWEEEVLQIIPWRFSILKRTVYRIGTEVGLVRVYNISRTFGDLSSSQGTAQNQNHNLHRALCGSKLQYEAALELIMYKY